MAIISAFSSTPILTLLSSSTANIDTKEQSDEAVCIIIQHWERRGRKYMYKFWVLEMAGEFQESSTVVV